MHVLVIGAGTGGLCLAQKLKRAGISVAVYERDRTRTDGLFGFRVGISPDGSRALRACLPPELHDTFRATAAITPRYLNMLTEQRRELLSIDNAGMGTVEDEHSVSRMTLRQLLLTGVEDVVHFDKKFTRYERNDDGTVTAWFADGTSATGDVLVGADGTGSPVRRQYLPHATLRETGLFGITGKLPLTEQTAKLLTPKIHRGVSMVFGPRGDSAIIHVMEFNWNERGEVKHGIGGNDAQLLARWPGLQFDNTRDYIMLGFGSHRRYLPENFMDLDGPALHRILRERTASWHRDLRTLFELVDTTTCFPLNIRTTEPVAPWETTNVTLIGDAIHTMTPGLGVGANTALRDARILGENLVAARDSGRSALDAIRDYEERMHGYAWDAVKKSLERFDGESAVYKPGIGRLAQAGMRTGLRLVNHLPPVKRRMAAAQGAERGHNRAGESTP
ncbi:FAD-dependent oxidoreductase [Amycolatopsis sp. NPDC058986]|uniref:FAD-dependent oxidoreductase n=1 Tax=unclassified Amycolatopsis TaxID=2618356 RepID=UPI00366A8A55